MKNNKHIKSFNEHNEQQKDSDFDIIKSNNQFTKCYYCNRKYNYTEALHEDDIYVQCPYCGHYMKDLGRLGGYKHPSYS